MIGLILIISFILRLIGSDQSLWLDEAIGAIAARDFSYGKIVTEFLRFDNHPPLYYLFLKLWTSVFGYSEVMLRMPSIIFGILTLYLTYKIVRRINPGNNSTSILATLFLGTSQLHIYYSQESRMYSMATFAAALCIYAFIQTLQKRSIGNWLLFSFSLVFLVFTDYIPIYLLPVFFVSVLFSNMPREWWKKLMIAYIPLILLGFLWLPTFIIQVKGSVDLLSEFPGWRSVVGGSTLKQFVLVWMKFVFGRISLVDKQLYYLLIASASIPVLISLLHTLKKRNDNTLIIWLWFSLPLSLGFIISIFFPSFTFFRFLYVLPAFYILIAIGISAFKNNYVRNSLIVSIIFFNLLSWGIYIFDKKQQREQWREAVSFIEQVATKDDIVLFAFSEPFAPYRWYSSGKVKAIGALDAVYATSSKSQQKIKNSLGEASTVYYFEYLWQLSDPSQVVGNTLKTEGFGVKSIYDFTGVGFIYEYEKQ